MNAEITDCRVEYFDFIHGYRTAIIDYRYHPTARNRRNVAEWQALAIAFASR